jgi:hypothetical protein
MLWRDAEGTIGCLLHVVGPSLGISYDLSFDMRETRSVMSCPTSHSPLSGLSSTPSAHSSNITPAPNIPWHIFGAAQDHLLKQLDRMYWDGVKGELEITVRTLRTWQQPKHNSITTNQTEDKFKESLARKPKLSYEDALAICTLDLQADRSSSEIEATIREAIEGG